ncbi:hypothetical protein LCGC14_3018640, partial [marine sediment metagenome]
LFTEFEQTIPLIWRVMVDVPRFGTPLRVDLSWSPTRWSEKKSLACDTCDGVGKTSKISGEEALDAIYRGDEARLAQAGLDPTQLMATGSDWTGFEPILAEWIDEAAAHLARAAITVASVIDFATVVIDGGFPTAIRTRLADAIRTQLGNQDCRGIARPDIIEGSIGRQAQAIGAGALPIFAHYLLDSQSAQL